MSKISTADSPNTPPTIPTNPHDLAWSPEPRNYQYWAVKFQPYLKFALNTVINLHLGKWASMRVTLNIDDFQASIWGDAAMWYQFDTSNPTNPSKTSAFYSASTKYETNYKNYFLCSDAGVNVKPILMSINV